MGIRQTLQKQPSSAVLQRKCACGRHGGNEECSECRKEREIRVQREAVTSARPGARSGHDFGRISVHPGAPGAPGGLEVSSPGDRDEQEADRIAERVMRMPADAAPPGDAGAPPGASPGGSGGSPLDPATRGFMERRFGADFGSVRVHTGDDAVRASRDLNARAFTLGDEIFFDHGHYRPATWDGRHLLAHELSHVLQQRSPAAAPKIRRSITVRNAGDVPPHLQTAGKTPDQLQDIPTEFRDQTAGQVAARLLNTLCPDGRWSVGSDGLVSAGATDLCRHRGLRTTSFPASCTCLCELTGPGGLTAFLNITEQGLEPGSGELDSSSTNVDSGHGQTTTDLSVPLRRRSFHVGVSGRSGSVLGVGDTTAQADAQGHRQLRDPAWIILGHELCGHVRRNLSRPRSRDFEHTMSEDYDTSAVDIENAIRREHSTAADNLGIRFGDFFDFADCRHFGLVYQIKLGARVSTLERKFNIPHDTMMSRDADAISTNSFLNCSGRAFDPHSPQQVYKHVFLYRPDEPVAFIRDGCANHHFKVGERVFLEGVFAHRVIAGDTKTSIARMWNVTVASIATANEDINRLHTFADTAELPVGMVVVIPYNRTAASVFFSCP